MRTGEELGVGRAAGGRGGGGVGVWWWWWGGGGECELTPSISGAGGGFLRGRRPPTSRTRGSLDLVLSSCRPHRQRVHLQNAPHRKAKQRVKVVTELRSRSRS